MKLFLYGTDKYENKVKKKIFSFYKLHAFLKKCSEDQLMSAYCSSFPLFVYFFTPKAFILDASLHGHRKVLRSFFQLVIVLFLTNEQDNFKNLEILKLSYSFVIIHGRYIVYSIISISVLLLLTLVCTSVDLFSRRKAIV